MYGHGHAERMAVLQVNAYMIACSVSGCAAALTIHHVIEATGPRQRCTRCYLREVVDDVENLLSASNVVWFNHGGSVDHRVRMLTPNFLVSLGP